MDYEEICAEKLRAINERARYRDFYDLYLMLEKFRLNIKKVLQILKQKETRKPISKTSILSNWKIAKNESKLNTVLYTKNISESDILKMINTIKF